MGPLSKRVVGEGGFLSEGALEGNSIDWRKEMKKAISKKRKKGWRGSRGQRWKAAIVCREGGSFTYAENTGGERTVSRKWGLGCGEGCSG